MGVRLSDAGLTWLDSEAERRGLVTASGRVNRSEMIRLALLYSQQHMPAKWRPSVPVDSTKEAQK